VISPIAQIRITTPYPEGSVNVYVLTEPPVTLVDSGLRRPDSLEQLEAGLARLGLSWPDIEQVVVTHMHTDHSGGVAEIQRLSGATVWVHEAARRQLSDDPREWERTEAFYRQFAVEAGAGGVWRRNRPFRPWGWQRIRYLRDGDRIQAGGRQWQVLYVPGHSRTDLCLWYPETGDALVGDHLLRDISANAFVEPPVEPAAERPKPLLEYRRSMARTRALPWTTVYPGHGEPFTNHRELIDQRFAEHEARCDRIRQALAEGAGTVYELSRTLFPRLADSALFLGLSEVQGHLDLMESRGEVTSTLVDGVRHYRQTACP
jgi:glyoxylase-like metal-dependent hydrolase (beta-lactamase superfamily II)